MDANQFTWWLHGFTEITNGAHPTQEQWATIKDHLNLVFNKVTPNRFEGSVGYGSDQLICRRTDPTLPSDQTEYCGGGKLPSITGGSFFTSLITC